MGNECDVYTQDGDFDKVVASATEAQGILHKIGDMKMEAKAWGIIAQAHLSSGKYEAARWAAERAQSLYKDTGDGRNEAAALLIMAQAYWSEYTRKANAGLDEAQTVPLLDKARSVADDAVAVGER